METTRNHTRFFIPFLYLTLVATVSFTQCEAIRSIRFLKGTLPGPTKHSNLFLSAANKLNLINRIDFPLEGSKDIQPYGVDSPFTLPPYDSLPPISLPENTPPYYTTPPNTPETPPTTVPTPFVLSPPSILPIQIPPPSPTSILPGPPESISTPNLPGTVPSPTGFVPTPTIYIPSPPYFEPSPPGLVPNPPSFGFQPSPPVFLPPIVFPPPTTLPSPRRGPTAPLWCVAKPSVPDPIIQEAMNYACGSGADCASIQPNGPCFNPDSLLAHASYAFNSYWQRTRVAGGTCSFGGTAILVTIDPSYDGCQFDYY